jgi:phosphomannomutase/phosphoglucomutase
MLKIDMSPAGADIAVSGGRSNLGLGRCQVYHDNIFREYDIRGVVDKDYDDDFARLLGRAFARALTDHGGKTAAVSQDCRLSSPTLTSAMIEGIRESGVDVVDVGINTTPMLYFSLFNLPVDGGVQVSGSHNPPDQNGFKVCIGKETLYGDGIQHLRQIIEQKNFPRGKGKLSSHPVREEYINWITSHIKLDKKLKVVTDSGNGTAGPVGPVILRKLGCEVIDLFSEMDGRFPNHHPDPTQEKYLKDLVAQVLEVKADLGIGYDGDADRIGVVTDQGAIVWGDMVLMLLARGVLQEVPGSTIIGEVKCSHLLYDDIEKHGGRAIMWKAGHSLIKAKMREEKAALGGEMSGHIFFSHRYFGYDDAIYTSCRFLEMMSKTDEKLSAIVARIPRTFSTPEIRIDSSDERKFDIVARITEYFKQKNCKVIDVDGVRVVFPDGWGLVRASNTQPMLVMRFEAESEKRLDEIRAMVEQKVNELNV